MKLSIRVDDMLHLRLKRAAKREHRSLNNLAEVIFEDYLEQREPHKLVLLTAP